VTGLFVVENLHPVAPQGEVPALQLACTIVNVRKYHVRTFEKELQQMARSGDVADAWAKDAVLRHDEEAATAEVRWPTELMITLGVGAR
jgi:hypothetical protein